MSGIQATSTSIVQQSSTPEVKSAEVSQVIEFIRETRVGLTESYERLKYAGYLSLIGALFILCVLVLSIIPRVNFEFREQVLYVITGFLLILAGGAMLALKTILLYRLKLSDNALLIRQTIYQHERTIKVLEQGPGQGSGEIDQRQEDRFTLPDV